MKSCTKKDLIELGFGSYQAKRIIQQAKQEMVNRGFCFYAGKGVGRVPNWVIEEILGFNIITGEEDVEL